MTETQIQVEFMMNVFDDPWEISLRGVLGLMIIS